MATQTQKISAPLRTITPRGPNTLTLRLDASLSYQPGQAIQIQFPGDTKPRFFSISSSPTEPGYIEITIKSDPSHPMAQILPKLKRGDTAELEGPFGSFRIPDPLPKALCFIAAGSGVTPFRSMIKYLLDNEAPCESWLLHSVKTQVELIFADEFSEWSGTQKQFHYIPTITQDFDDNWTNETGRINDVLIRKHVAKAAPCFLLCGPPAFVSDMEALLKNTMQVPADRVRREQW